MSGPDHTSAPITIDHGAASGLFPVEELETQAFQYRDAELVLTEADADEIAIVSPSGFASALFLHQHTLTAIPIADLPVEIQSSIDAALEIPVETFEFVQIGNRPYDGSDRSLTEFVDT